ncbi:hypothetical protein ACJJTC_009494 [Scirpophaga incertulas]
MVGDKHFKRIFIVGLIHFHNPPIATIDALQIQLPHDDAVTLALAQASHSRPTTRPLKPQRGRGGGGVGATTLPPDIDSLAQFSRNQQCAGAAVLHNEGGIQNNTLCTIMIDGNDVTGWRTRAASSDALHRQRIGIAETTGGGHVTERSNPALST